MMKRRALWAGVFFSVGIILLLMGLAFTLLVLLCGGHPALPNSSHPFVKAVNLFITTGFDNSFLLLLTGLLMMNTGIGMREQVIQCSKVKALSERTKKLQEQIVLLTEEAAALRAEKAASPSQEQLPASAAGPRRRAARYAVSQQQPPEA